MTSDKIVQNATLLRQNQESMQPNVRRGIDTLTAPLHNNWGWAALANLPKSMAEELGIEVTRIDGDSLWRRI
ncbi:hypothetical protein HCU40_06080 [Pseudanabaena biceps]|nr:hypothetical protein [Pseudanabaena biceps]